MYAVHNAFPSKKIIKICDVMPCNAMPCCPYPERTKKTPAELKTKTGKKAVTL